MKEKVALAWKLGPIAVGYAVDAYAGLTFYSQPHTFEEGLAVGTALVAAGAWLGYIAFRQVYADPTTAHNGVTVTIEIAPTESQTTANGSSEELGSPYPPYVQRYPGTAPTGQYEQAAISYPDPSRS